MIYALLMILCIILIIVYYILEKDAFQPSIIVCAVYILSVLCAIYNIDNWQINLHFNTVAAIISGIVTFISMSLIIHTYFHNVRMKRNINIKSKITLKKITISNWKNIIVIVSAFIFLVLNFYYVLKIAGKYGKLENYSQIMTTYREKVAYGSESLPFLLNQFGKIIKVLSFIMVYVFINNVIVDKSIKENVIYIVEPIVYLITTLMTAERAAILQFFVSSMGMIYILLRKKNGETKNINNKFIKRALIAVCVILILFSSSRKLVGRTSDLDILTYITTYAGGSIELLDLYLQDPSTAEYFGEEVFFGLRKDLSKFIPSIQVKDNQNLEFRFSANGVAVGNVYTGLRKSIHDFGYIGIFVFQSILAMIYTTMYELILSNPIKSKIDLRIVFYSYLLYPLFLQSIQDTFFGGYVCFSTIVYFALFIVLIKLLVKDNKLENEKGRIDLNV